MDLITEQRLARRESILETARQAIAEVGYEAVTVRDLADRCRVSVPTLYNQFGGKDQLLGEAITLHFQRMLGGTGLVETISGFNRLLKVIDQCAEQLLTSPAYHRRLLEAFISLDQTAAVQQRVALALTGVMEVELKVMQGAGQIRDWVETGLVAEQLTSACISAAIIWSSGVMPDANLTPTMRYATGLVLAGVVEGEIEQILESRLRDSQRQLLKIRGTASRGKTTAKSSTL